MSEAQQLNDFNKWMAKNYPMFELTGDLEEDTTARLVRCVAGDVFVRLQEAKRLLSEARVHLPLAAAAWFDDENEDVGEFHGGKVMGLVGEIDNYLGTGKLGAADEKPQPLPDSKP